MLVQCRMSSLTEVDPEWKEVSSVDFIISHPILGLLLMKKHVLPPRNILNELFEKGSVDAGMSGQCEWKPFSIKESDFYSIRSELERQLSITIRKNSALDNAQTYKKWYSIALSID